MSHSRSYAILRFPHSMPIIITRLSPASSPNASWVSSCSMRSSRILDPTCLRRSCQCCSRAGGICEGLVGTPHATKMKHVCLYH
jgi:hypothetical protein